MNGAVLAKQRPFFVRTALACLLLTAVSMALTGFDYGVVNNVYHIPYVLRYAQSPEFAGDAFVASLDKFTSVMWPLVRLIANEENIHAVFFGVAFVSRWLALAAILYLVGRNGMSTPLERIACLGVIAATPLMTGYSPIGSDGLFLRYLTHSEVTWPAVFMSLALMERNRPGAAGAFTGLAFALNAFIGIWMVFVNVFSRLWDTRRLPPPIDGLRYGGALAVVSAPVLVWVAVAVLGARPAEPFSYIAYIRGFYPNHFLIEAAAPGRLAVLGLMFAEGLAAALYTPRPRYWVGVQLGILAWLVIGSVLPYVLNARFVFNLHMLRADGLQQAVCIVLCAIAAVALVARGKTRRERWMGVVLLTCLLTWPKAQAGLMLPVALLALLSGLSLRAEIVAPLAFGRVLRRFEQPLAWFASLGLLAVLGLEAMRLGLGAGLVLRSAILVVAAILIWRPRLHAAWSPAAAAAACSIAVVLVSALAIRGRLLEQEEPSAQARDWEQIMAWVRGSDSHGVFLLPLDKADEFMLKARRPVWAGSYTGAAVMWEPSFYGQWRRRSEEIKSLSSASEFIAYAGANGIRNVVIDSDSGSCSPLATEVVKFGRFALCRVDPKAAATDEAPSPGKS